MSYHALRPAGISALTAFLAILLTGCSLNVPNIDTATVRGSSAVGIAEARALDRQQVRELKDWLARHDTGWSRSMGSYAPMIVIQARSVDGAVSSLYINQNVVAVSTGDRQDVRTLTAAEYAEIRGILNPAALPPK